MALSREYLEKTFNTSVHLREYYKLMVRVAVFLGANKTQAKADLLSVVQFEQSLAEVRQVNGQEFLNRSKEFSNIVTADFEARGHAQHESLLQQDVL